MIQTEAWYKEAAGEEREYARLLALWNRTEDPTLIPEGEERGDPQLLDDTYRAQVLEQILRLHRRMGRDPEEMMRLLLPLDRDWDWWDLVSKVPRDLLPPVTFQVAFFIERYIDTDSEGVPGMGYVNSLGELYGPSPYLEGEEKPWTMSIPEFFNFLESVPLQGWGSGSYLLSEMSLYDRDAPTWEWDSRTEGEDEELESFSKELFNYRNNIRWHWRYSEWYSETEDELPEEYLEEMGGWITTLQIQVPSAGLEREYYDLVKEWARLET